jgi:type IV secretion system protein VirB9
MRSVLVLTLALLAASFADAQTTREVMSTDRSVIPVHTKVRFTTMILLPEGEQILDFVCGDKDYWVISGAENLAYVKPARTGAQTNLNLVTASGRVYSFVLSEGGNEPDLKLYVTRDASLPTPAGGESPRFFAASQVEELRKQAEDARRDADAARAAAARAVDEGIGKFRAAYPAALQFPYRYKPNEKPFHVSAIFHDGRFTYIRAAASELPSLYEIRDGVPNLVNFQVENGLYVVPKVVERGYLAVGKQRFAFEAR